MAFCALTAAGCGTAHQAIAPPADVVAEQIMTRNESPQDTQRWLVTRGFQQIQRTGYGGVWPKTGPCFQTIKGIRYRAQTVTRVCFAAETHPVVLMRETRGYYWSEVYPLDLSYNLHDPSGLGGLSDETLEILKQ